MRKGKRWEAVEKLMKAVGAKVEVKEVKRMRDEWEERREMMWVKLGSEEQRLDEVEVRKEAGDDHGGPDVVGKEDEMENKRDS